MTLAEQRLGMQCYPYGEGVVSNSFSSDAFDVAKSNTHKLSRLAAMWSLDPSTLDGRLFRRGNGVVGVVEGNR